MRRLARLGAVVASASLAVTGLAVLAPPAQAVPVPDPLGVDTGAAWLQGQLTNDIVRNDQFNFDDYGLTADFAFALDAIGGRAGAVEDIVDALEAGAEASWYTSTFGGVTTTFTGSVAKLMVLVQTAGGTPTSYGGENLQTLLESRTAGSAPITGRIEDLNNGFGDANVIGQSYAARALADAGSGEAAAAINFLLAQQCPNGGFRLAFTADKTASGQSCIDNAQVQLDVTSIALLQLRELTPTVAVNDAIEDAEDWLVGRQRLDGAWGGDPGGSLANANSTGLAGWALGDTPASADGATWLRDHQATHYDVCTRLSSRIGAVAYDGAGLSAGRSNGIVAGTQDEFRRATAQSVPALQYLETETANQAPQVTGPAGFLKAGRSYAFRVTGVLAGEEMCLTTTGARSGGTVTTVPATRSLYLNNATAVNRTVTVRDRNNHVDNVVVKVLSRKSLLVTKAKYRNKRRSFATVTVYGLVPGEQARIFFRGKLRANGVADANGHFRRSIWTGRKLGKGTVAGYGQYGDIRKGYTKIKVVR